MIFLCVALIMGKSSEQLLLDAFALLPLLSSTEQIAHCLTLTLKTETKTTNVGKILTKLHREGKVAKFFPRKNETKQILWSRIKI